MVVDILLELQRMGVQVSVAERLTEGLDSASEPDYPGTMLS
jgi:hypothetical protein